VKADKPNTIKLMLMGAVLSVLLGLVVPFGLELLNRRVRCRDDLERNIGIPVLAEFRGIDPAPLHN
jgi:capsular polysaccharide biosynthesis protein